MTTGAGGSHFTPRNLNRYPSFHLKCGVNGSEQGCVAEWLEQALDRTLFQGSRTQRFIFLGSHEYDGNGLPAQLQFLLKVGPAHSRHKDVQDQTTSLVHTIGGEELFC